MKGAYKAEESRQRGTGERDLRTRPHGAPEECQARRHELEVGYAFRLCLGTNRRAGAERKYRLSSRPRHSKRKRSAEPNSRQRRPSSGPLRKGTPSQFGRRCTPCLSTRLRNPRTRPFTRLRPSFLASRPLLPSLAPHALDLSLPLPARPHAKLVLQPAPGVLDPEVCAVQRARGRRNVDGGEEGPCRGRGEEDELAFWAEERVERLGKVAVRRLIGVVPRSVTRERERERRRSRARRTSLRNGGSAIAMSTLPLSASGNSKGSSRSYLTNLSPATSPNRASYSNRKASRRGFSCWNPT